MMRFGAGELAILMTFGIPIAAIIGVFLLLALSMLLGKGSKSKKGLDAEEARAMQEIHRGLTTLEKRVESLETLLLERAREEKWAELEKDK